MGLVGFEYPLRAEKKLLLEQENLDSVLKLISTWGPASILILKMWILKMSVQQTKIFEFLKTSISKWKNGESKNEPPPIIGHSSPLKSKIFSSPPKTQNSKIPTLP